MSDDPSRRFVLVVPAPGIAVDLGADLDPPLTPAEVERVVWGAKVMLARVLRDRPKTHQQIVAAVQRRAKSKKTGRLTWLVEKHHSSWVTECGRYHVWLQHALIHGDWEYGAERVGVLPWLTKVETFKGAKALCEAHAAAEAVANG